MTLSNGAWTALTTVHAAATWWLMGLIWTIQVVHYPSFDSIDRIMYADFQDRHMQAMGRLIGFPWLIEGLCVLGLFVFAPDNTTRVLAGLGGLLEIVVIAVTITKSIPAHEALRDGYVADAHRTLVDTNWWRTAAWSLRGAIALAVLLR